MPDKCVVCNIQEFMNGESSRLFKISHHPKLNLGFMLTFVSGLEAEHDSCLCITCYNELETSFSFKQKWHQSKLYKVENLKSDSGAFKNQFHTMKGNDTISYEILEVDIEAQNELGEDSNYVPVTTDTNQNNSNNDEWWRCVKREKSIEIEDTYAERLANGEIESVHDDPLAYKKEDVYDEIPRAQIQEVIQMISEDSSELIKLPKQCDNVKNNEQDHATIRCEICYKTFTKISTCRIHLKRIHAVEKNPNRSVKGRRKYPISEHDIFNNLKETQCEFCFKICRNLNGLDNHKKCHEKEEQPYRCNKAGCTSRFAYKHRARSHIVNHEEKRFKCRYCDKMFNYSYNAVVHERTHTGEKPYACSYCGRAFASFYNMNAHTRLHTGEEPYKCSHCPKTFKSHSAHKIHELSHSHTKPYKCSVCQKDFISSWHCKSHERIHTGEKPYKCQICKKAFIDSTRLGAHKKIHTGTAPKRRRKEREEKLEI